MEFKETISQLSGIPAENIEYAKIQTTSFLRDSNSVLNIHTNLTWLHQSMTLETYPLNQSQDGHLYYYRWVEKSFDPFRKSLINNFKYFHRDRLEPLKELSPEERKELTSKENSRTSSSYSSPRRERALKIYLDSSPNKLHDWLPQKGHNNSGCSSFANPVPSSASSSSTVLCKRRKIVL